MGSDHSNSRVTGASTEGRDGGKRYAKRFPTDSRLPLRFTESGKVETFGKQKGKNIVKRIP